MHADDHDAHGPGGGTPHDRRAATSSEAMPGLAMADSGLRLEADPTIVAAGERFSFAFRIARGRAEAVTSFDQLHERRMHLIAVRRDLTGFQHLHPEMEENGTWHTNLTLPTAGAWRAFADFATDGVGTTLGIDLFAGGDFRPEPLPEPSTTFTDDGDHVSLEASHGVLRFTVRRDGEPVEVEPYLGARGHLVVLRWGDLAFLHVHPLDEDDIAFAVKYPSEGTYRLFLQYSAGGDVRTAAFTAAAS